MVTNTITQYELEGFYNYVNAPNGQGRLTGQIDVDADGAFEGEITDHASMSPQQFLKGHLKHEGGLDRLLFLKFPRLNCLANLAYALQKEHDGAFDGKYAGEWKALPYKVEYNKEFGVYVASVDMSVAGLGDTAEITLFRK